MPKYAYTHDGKPNPQDRIIESKGPYIKIWCSRVVYVEEHLTRRDFLCTCDGRMMAYKHKDGAFKLLANRDGPKWIAAHVSPVKLA